MFLVHPKDTGVDPQMHVMQLQLRHQTHLWASYFNVCHCKVKTILPGEIPLTVLNASRKESAAHDILCSPRLRKRERPLSSYGLVTIFLNLSFKSALRLFEIHYLTKLDFTSLISKLSMQCLLLPAPILSFFFKNKCFSELLTNHIV